MTGRWKSGKPKTGFPLSHPVHAMTTTVLSLNRKTKRKEVGRYAASLFFMPLSLRSSGTDFMLIFQLENASAPSQSLGAMVSLISGWMPHASRRVVEEAAARNGPPWWRNSSVWPPDRL
jgi:hypothetical protein